MGKIVNWVKNNKVEFATLVAILVTGSFLRLYKIDQYMTFLGDEGRDVIVVSRFIKYFDIMLVGPGTSIGNMYLGPLYYYMIALPLLVTNFSPVGPAAMVALLGVATIAFVWWVGRKWFGKVAAIVASGLYAISPTVIIYSRSSWNPNIIPFFALLSIYSIWKIWNEGKYKWLLVLGTTYAFVLQSHYLGLLLVPTLLLFWLIEYKKIKRSGSEVKKYLVKSIIGLIIFTFLMSPLVIFDARHGWRNFGAMKTFFTASQSDISVSPWTAVPKAWPIFEKATTRLLASRDRTTGIILSLFLVFSIGWIIVNWKKLDAKLHPPYSLLFAWLGFALLGLGLYRKEIYDHYFGFIFPAPFLLIGGISQLLSQNKKSKIAVLVTLFVLIFVNLWNTPIRSLPNLQMQRSMYIADFIKNKSGEERFNIATISERSNRDVYQYFLLLWGAKVVDTDPSAVAYTVTDQLFVVCEMPKEKCDPTHDPSAWITNFGWTKIVDQWEVWGTNVYKLGHAK